jgi:protease-4
MGLFASMAAATALNTKQVTVVDGSLSQTIAAIPVTDIITDATAHQFDQYLSAAESDKTVKAIVLEVDTPGGSASASEAMHHRLERFRINTKAAGRTVPVVVAMGGMATSGGYYVSCGADYIFAQPATMTANIGVLMERFNVSELCDKYGIKETTIVGSGGEYKNLGSMFQPETEQARQYLQGLADVTLDQFKKVVVDGRGDKLTDKSVIFNGRVYMGEDALKLGLIDKIGYNEDAYDYAKTAANAAGARVVRYQPPSALERILDSSSSSSSANMPGHKVVNIDGVNIDLARLGDLIAPRPMFLWRGN